jgi:2'-5' RNA ligase
VALPLPRAARTRLVRWQREAFTGHDRLRPVSEDNLHVTIAFLGSTPAASIRPVVAAMRKAARGMSAPVFTPTAYRETHSVAMVVLDDAGERAAALAERVFERLEALDLYEREQRRWLPHVTVARFRQRPGLSPPVPELGALSPSEVALYHSVLRPAGAQYEIVESVALGGPNVGA